MSESAQVVKPTRNDLRARIFAGKKLKTKVIEFFGSEIELRQSNFGGILDAQAREDRQSAILEALIAQAFVPGTEEKVFEEADVETLKELPFGADFLRVSSALEELTEVNFLDKKGTSEPDQTSTS